MKAKGKLVYSRVFTPDETYHNWSTNLVVDKEERDRIVEATGLKVARTDGALEEYGDYFFKINRYVEGRGKAKGKKNKAPSIYLNGELQEEPFEFGWGSEGEVEFRPWEWSYKGRKGVSADLERVNVTKIVEYVPDDSTDDADTEEEEVDNTPPPAQW